MTFHCSFQTFNPQLAFKLQRCTVDSRAISTSHFHTFVAPFISFSASLLISRLHFSSHFSYSWALTTFSCLHSTGTSSKAFSTVAAPRRRHLSSCQRFSPHLSVGLFFSMSHPASPAPPAPPAPPAQRSHTPRPHTHRDNTHRDHTHRDHNTEITHTEITHTQRSHTQRPHTQRSQHRDHTHRDHTHRDNTHRDHTHTEITTQRSHFELGFSVRLNFHVGKEGEGTERRISPQKTVLLNKVSTGVRWRASVQFSCMEERQKV